MKSLNRNTVFIEFICQRLGVPSLLDPQDMAQSSVVDRLSILTYLAEFYHKFKTVDLGKQIIQRNKGVDKIYGKLRNKRLEVVKKVI